MLTIQDVAKRMDWHEYGCELPANEAAELKAAGIVAVYGANDDMCKFGGAIDDEVDCYDGGTIYLDRHGVKNAEDVQDAHGKIGWQRYKDQAAKIKAEWCKNAGGPSWTYSTTIPHAVFSIMDDDETYCVGIVFKLSDLPVVDL